MTLQAHSRERLKRGEEVRERIVSTCCDAKVRVDLTGLKARYFCEECGKLCSLWIKIFRERKAKCFYPRCTLSK